MEQCILGEKFMIRKKIGAGSFGEIYSGENIKTHRRVAIKLEKKDCKIPQLYYESKLYTILQGGPGIASIYWYGNDDNHNAMVIDMLGKSLETLFKQCNSHFSLKTVLMLADQMITCIEYFHQKNYIHRDIKPDNFVLGLGSKSNQVFMIDFGLAKRYRDNWSHQHIPFSSGNSLTGTARYSSLNALKGSEQSRRDDLEALGYVLLYFLRGDLPWMGKQTQEQEFKYQMITYIKEQTSFEDLCCGFPDELVQYFYLVRNLGFAEKPNYTTYRKIFRDLFIKCGYVYDDQYDWVISSNLNTNTTQTQTQNQNQTQNSNNIIKQDPIPKSIPKEQHSHPKLVLHKKTERTISAPKSENIVEIKEKKISPTKSAFTCRSTDPKKLIENPYFIKKSPTQQQLQPHKSQQQQVHINQYYQPKYYSPTNKIHQKLEKNLEYTGKSKT